MATKVKAQKFDRINKSVLRIKGKVTRTGASTAGKTRAHGRARRKQRG